VLITRRRSPWILLDQWQNSADAQENRPAVQQRENRKRQGFEPGLRIPSPDRPGVYVHKDSGDAFCACSRLGKVIISPCFFLEGKKSSCLTFQKSNNKNAKLDNFHTGHFLAHLCKYLCIHWQQISKVHLLPANTH